MDITDYIVDLKQFKIVNRLDPKEEGAFGKIFIVKKDDTDEKFIAKVSITEILAGEAQVQFFRELTIILNAKHQTILALYGFSISDFQNKPYPTILTPFMSNGSLRHVFDMEYKGMAALEWNQQKKQICIFGIAIGMAHLHKIGIIHRDIKPANILLDENFYPKICDFGISKICCDDKERIKRLSVSTSNVGTPVYMAPEVFEFNQYPKAVDVYSFALVLYEFYSYQEPEYKDKTFYQLCSCVKNGLRPDISCFDNNEKKEFIQKCWAYLPEERPTFNQIVDELLGNRALWIKNVDESEIYDYLFKLGINVNDKESTTDNKNEPIAEINHEECEKTNSKRKIIEKPYPFQKPFGNSDEMNVHANKLRTGDCGIEKNTKEAIKFYLQAIELGNSDAMNNYATMLENGEGDEKNLEKAKKFYLQAIKLGNSDAMNNYAMLCLHSDDEKIYSPADAAKYFEQAIKQGNIPAMLNYAYALHNGAGSLKNLGKAADYYQLYIKNVTENGGLVSLEDSIALCNYANLLLEGEVIEKNVEKAIEYYLLAIKLGSSDAMNNYAMMLENGEGIEKNPGEAVKYYLKAIELGNSNAMSNYAMMLAKGVGIQKNTNDAVNYFKQAIKLGNCYAERNFANMVDIGLLSE